MKNQQKKVNSIISCSKHTKQKNDRKNLKKWEKNLDTRKQIKYSKTEKIICYVNLKKTRKKSKHRKTIEPPYFGADSVLCRA